MNRQFRKIETPYNRTIHNQTITQEQKRDLENLKRIMSGEKTTLTSLKKNRMENNQDGNGKNKSNSKLYIKK